MPAVRIWGARAGQLLPYLLPEIDACRRRGERVILLVPEQYTLQAERELVEGLALPGLIDIDVLSPRRLTRRIREYGGYSGLAPLDDRGRSMAIAQALTIAQDEMTYYKRVALTPGLPDKLSVLMADFQRSGLTPEALQEHAESSAKGAFKAKEADLALIWKTYLGVIEGRFADETMQQRETVRRLRVSGVMEGVHLFVYGFDVLPQPLCDLLAEAAAICPGVTVTMTMDSREAADGRIFLTQRRSAAELMERLGERDIDVQWRYLPAREIGRSPALSHLEKHLFTRQAIPFEGESSGVMVHAAANPYAEAAHIAQRLRAWHDEGMPWQRMVVSMAESASMPGILSVTLRAAGIPHYVARKDSALRHGLCRLLVGALRCATGNYAVQDVFTMAKSGFSPIAIDEAHALENYAISHGVNRNKWLKPFTRGDNAGEMEALRGRLVAPVEALRDRLRQAKTAAQSVEAVFQLLEDVQAYEALLSREEALLQRGMAAEAAQNRQVWQIVMDLLDQLHALLGEHRAAMKDIARFVESGLTGAVISSLPPQPDAVMLGEAGHLMTGRIDALILCGMQDGVLGSTMDSLITENERRQLSDAMHRAIGLTRQETAALRQSDFYRTVALPRERLLVTFSQGGQDGTALRPSGMIDDMKALFPGLVITGGVMADGMDEPPLSPQMALDGLALRLRAMAEGETEALDPAWADALRYLWQSPEWHERIRTVIANLNAQVGQGRLTLEQTRRLFTQDKVSISRLERFAQCPYQHYVDYGLKPVKREAYAFEANDAGDFYHAALQGYAHAAMQRPDWPELPEDEVDRLMDSVLAPLTAEWAEGPLGDTPAQRLQGERYVRTVKRAAWLFTRHARNSRFTTIGEEVVFGEEGGLPPVVLTLKDGRRIALRGKIDRIDRWQGDKGVYLRVIDYKSSKRDIDPTRLWYGLQLQLMLYLQAASQGLKGEAAGAFYFTVKDPMVDAEDVKEAAEKAIAKQLRLEGVMLADVEVIDAMDVERGLSLGSIFTPTGKLSSTAPAYTPEEMQALLEHTKEVAAMLADGMREGDISVSPAAIGDWSACEWCEYAAVCGIDPTIPGCTKRVLPRLTRQELLGKMTNQEDERT
ncbi:MAG: PD-(D/E)XK nuclease family protein [Clostridia bacterium]|nr:PD-(D/E)XK nuclease family protein [Clostridia bacterium]